MIILAIAAALAIVFIAMVFIVKQIKTDFFTPEKINTDIQHEQEIMDNWIKLYQLKRELKDKGGMV